MQIKSCYNGGSALVCFAAQDYCNTNIINPLVGVWDVYYILSANPDPYPPDITGYLYQIQTTVGAESVWQEESFEIYDNFAATGDWMHNSRPDLESVINAGVSL
jgi:hypothetical protein